MKLTASNPAEQRRQLILLAVLVVVGAGVWYTQYGPGATDATVSASNSPVPAAGGAGQVAGGAMPQPVQLGALEPVLEQVSGARNPFAFGVPPAPPRPPAPPPAPPRAPVETPRPTAPTTPTRPPVPVKFLGFAEVVAGDAGKVVSLKVGDEVVMAREGDLVDGRYRLVKIGLESIEMTYADGQGRTTIRLTGQ